jgi:hypothetical protein
VRWISAFSWILLDSIIQFSLSGFQVPRLFIPFISLSHFLLPASHFDRRRIFVVPGTGIGTGTWYSLHDAFSTQHFQI